MFEANETLDSAMQKVAERLLYVRAKRADASPASISTQARNELGTLGVDPAAVNSAVSGLQQHTLTPDQALAGIHSGVPGAIEQIRNIPASIGVAGARGDTNDAISQLDVLGLKNVNPLSDYGNVRDALVSGGLGLGAAAAQSRVRENLRLRDLLYGSNPAAMRHVLPQDAYTQWDTLRRSPAQTANQTSSLGKLRDAVVGPQVDATRRAYLRAADAKAQATAATVAKAKGIKVPGGGLLGRFGVPLLAAAVPLLSREWGSSGYRAGTSPANRLVDATLAAQGENRNTLTPSTLPPAAPEPRSLRVATPPAANPPQAPALT